MSVNTQVAVVASRRVPLPGAKALGPANPHASVDVLIKLRRKKEVGSLDYRPTSSMERDRISQEYGADQKDIDLYQALLHETEPTKQRAMMREYETYVLDTQAHMYMMPWWSRIVPYRSYVKGWKISPSHYINQDLATIWLDE